MLDQRVIDESVVDAFKKLHSGLDQMSDTLKLVVESLSTVNTKLDKMDTLNPE
jgi:hypothetical protein